MKANNNNPTAIDFSTAILIRMSKCSVNRFKAVKAPLQPPQPPKPPSLDSSLQAMIAAREKQDTMWNLSEKKSVKELVKNDRPLW